jgi:hypothetical protein
MPNKINFHYTRTVDERKKSIVRREKENTSRVGRQILFGIIKIFPARPALFHKS